MIASAFGGAPEELALARESADAFLLENLPEVVFGSPKAGPGMWASLLRCLNPLDGTTTELIRFPQDEAAHTLTLARFVSRYVQISDQCLRNIPIAALYFGISNIVLLAIMYTSISILFDGLMFSFYLIFVAKSFLVTLCIPDRASYSWWSL